MTPEMRKMILASVDDIQRAGPSRLEEPRETFPLSTKHRWESLLDVDWSVEKSYVAYRKHGEGVFRGRAIPQSFSKLDGFDAFAGKFKSITLLELRSLGENADKYQPFAFLSALVRFVTSGGEITADFQSNQQVIGVVFRARFDNAVHEIMGGSCDAIEENSAKQLLSFELVRIVCPLAAIYYTYVSGAVAPADVPRVKSGEAPSPNATRHPPKRIDETASVRTPHKTDVYFSPAIHEHKSRSERNFYVDQSPDLNGQSIACGSGSDEEAPAKSRVETKKGSSDVKALALSSFLAPEAPVTMDDKKLASLKAWLHSRGYRSTKDAIRSVTYMPDVARLNIDVQALHKIDDGPPDEVFDDIFHKIYKIKRLDLSSFVITDKNWKIWDPNSKKDLVKIFLTAPGTFGYSEYEVKCALGYAFMLLCVATSIGSVVQSQPTNKSALFNLPEPNQSFSKILQTSYEEPSEEHSGFVLDQSMISQPPVSVVALEVPKTFSISYKDFTEKKCYKEFQSSTKRDIQPDEFIFEFNEKLLTEAQPAFDKVRKNDEKASPKTFINQLSQKLAGTSMKTTSHKLVLKNGMKGCFTIEGKGIFYLRAQFEVLGSILFNDFEKHINFMLAKFLLEQFSNPGQPCNIHNFWPTCSTPAWNKTDLFSTLV